MRVMVVPHVELKGTPHLPRFLRIFCAKTEKRLHGIPRTASAKISGSVRTRLKTFTSSRRPSKA